MSVSIKLIDGEDPKSLYQYDIGRQIQIITNGGETIKEVQFSNVRLSEALIVLPKLDESGNIIADVPNIFTLEPRIISVYLVTYLENGECVKYKDELNVVPRKKPSDYVYTETEVLNYSLLERQINILDSTKLTAPSSAQIGQIFRVQAINDDGTLTLEAVDMPSGGSGGAVNDVQINGESIVADGVAEIPIAKENNKFGMVQTSIYDGIIVNKTGYLVLMGASKSDIDRRINYSQGYAITTLGYDYAVKCAMCDGKGAEWTSDEQAAARARMGVEWTVIADVTLSEDTSVLVFNNFSCKELRFAILGKMTGTRVSAHILEVPTWNINGDTTYISDDKFAVNSDGDERFTGIATITSGIGNVGMYHRVCKCSGSIYSDANNVLGYDCAFNYSKETFDYLKLTTNCGIFCSGCRIVVEGRY